MGFARPLTRLSLDHPRLVILAVTIVTFLLGAFIPLLKVDTDPENMLPADAPVRVLHDQAKRTFGLSDMVVLGIINEKDPNGVFNVQSLNRIYELTEYLRSWQSKVHDGQGVVGVDLIAPSVVDHISQGGPGEVRFEWLMPRPITTDAEAMQIRQRVMSNPLFKGTMVSEDGRALCLYIPITSKRISHELYKDLAARLARWKGQEQYHITGLAVAEDTFGHEMFVQMAISAPMAMLVIFLLKWIFFRKLALIIAPMVVALVAVITTMGLLIGMGFPVHIMSSMIPIFLMPISVTDSVHILSSFFDRYTPGKGRKQTLTEVMSELQRPMLYTSLTTTAGFLSLALTPIPPVQVFGIFVAIGVMIAWVVTVTFVPAYVMLVSERYLAGFGAAAAGQGLMTRPSALVRFLRWTGGFTCQAARPIVAVVVAVCALGVYGLTRIRVNDNPTRWFSQRHPIRQADTQLNRHFAGTYMAFLVLEDSRASVVDKDFFSDILLLAPTKHQAVRNFVEGLASADPNITRSQWLDEAIDKASKLEADLPPPDAQAFAALVEALEQVRQQEDTFCRPDVLRYLVDLKLYLEGSGMVGKANCISDIVMKVHQELQGGDSNQSIIPDSQQAVAQCLMQYQSSHRPADLWHFVTSDYKKANIWLQLPSGDNKDMERVVQAVERYLKDYPSPVGLKHTWAGLTYLNLIWQEHMVSGMIMSLLGSFGIVFLMMVILFRSSLWGLLCMVPLSVTILLIYGVIGLLGKDYDMPVAVLSALTLGMAVDFAIHFLERARTTYQQIGSWKHCAIEMFQEPARAISRNVIVIAIGFLPLLVAPLVPYKTVGVLMCAILIVSGIVTLLGLPAILTVIEGWAFKTVPSARSTACNCGLCITVAAGVVIVVVLNLSQALSWTIARMLWISIIGIPLLALICKAISLSPSCSGIRTTAGNQDKEAIP